jgi:hypothetical protein
MVRAMIVLGEIASLNDLAAFCGPYVEWRATSATVDALVYNEVKHEQAHI